MSTFSLPYGRNILNFNLDESFLADLILPKKIIPETEGNIIVQHSITHPIPNFSWKNIQPSGRVNIAINDKTRPVPNDILIPPLLNQLEEIGYSPGQIEFVIATGTHLPMRSGEYEKVLSREIIAKYAVISHDCDDAANLAYLGETSRKTPLWINKRFYESDLKILVGNIEPHHFMGYSGGVKSAAIGLAGRQTININHAMLIEPESTFGSYKNNPTRLDIEEIGDLIHIHVALNIVMNQSRQIMHSFLGEPRDVLLTGIPFSQKICQTEIKGGGYDLVIASPGGFPKDINLYQAQKALSHAAKITRDGGCVILVASCEEGVGSRSYEDFMEGISSPGEAFLKIAAEGFKIGPHKALQFAREQSRIHIILVSTISPERIERLLLLPSLTMEDAIKKASEIIGKPTRTAIMPKATNTIPTII